VVLGAPGARGKEKRGKWIECGLLVLLGSRGKEEEHARARDTAAARWRRQSRGATWHAQERAREEELGRWSASKCRVGFARAGGGAREKLEWR
jgi:hypothetical protein